MEKLEMIKDGLTFDDVLLEPRYSEIKTRSLIDLSVKIDKLNKTMKHPIIPANMKTIIGYQMARAVYLSGGLGLLHRFISVDEQLNILHKLQEEFNESVWSFLGFSVGVKSEDNLEVDYLVARGAKILCIDVAHGHSKLCIDMCEYISNMYPHVLLIAGNVATYNGAYSLWAAGADIVKVGVGPGSLCTTRIETGNGVPQLSALMEASQSLKKIEASSHHSSKQRLIISDGGIKNAGDTVKALCLSDMVMVGNVFAGCEETPGEILTIDGRSYKEYVGSSTHKANHIEGVAAIVPSKGSFKNILTKMLEGIQSGCSYQGVNHVMKLKDNPVFIKITTSGLRESHPHDVI